MLKETLPFYYRRLLHIFRMDGESYAAQLCDVQFVNSFDLFGFDISVFSDLQVRRGLAADDPHVARFPHRLPRCPRAVQSRCHAGKGLHFLVTVPELLVVGYVMLILYRDE